MTEPKRKKNSRPADKRPSAAPDISSRPITNAERTDRIIRITDRIVERLSEAVEILDPDDTQHMRQIVSSLSEIIDIRKQSSSEASVITVNFEGDEDYGG